MCKLKGITHKLNNRPCGLLSVCKSLFAKVVTFIKSTRINSITNIIILYSIVRMVYLNDFCSCKEWKRKVCMMGKI